MVVYMVIVVLLFIFFFKQKTAYEMRISDWSSDVCSSDLLMLAAHVEDMIDHPLSPLPGVEWTGPTRKRADLIAMCDFRELDETERKRREFAFQGFEKIGRASCRERVCKYV